MERAEGLEPSTYSMANVTWHACKSLSLIALHRKSLAAKVSSMRAGDGSRGQDMTLALHPLQALQGRNVIPAPPAQLPA